jgi:RNA polymerase sigma factor (sigma-70 family)
VWSVAIEQTSTAGLSAALKWRRGLALRSQAARGDDAVLAAMYERHHQALYRYCRSILHDDEDARDALQSTMAKALAALRDEERDFELRPWLFRIAHNEAISRLRQRRDSVDLDAVGTLGTDSLAQTVEDRERLALLRADLRDLPDRQRSALVLRELSGLSHEEIAVVLDSSAGAIKQTIFEARAGLHECAEGRTMLCADVQRALSDGDGRVLRGRRVRAHVRSCRACRTFKTALVQRPADLAALAPALPTSAGAALLAHLLPGAKAGLASGAGAGGGMAATVASKVATVAVATATVAGTGSVVRDAVTAPDRDARPAAAAPSSPRAQPTSTPASALTSPLPAAKARVAGTARPEHRPSPAAADRRPAKAPQHPATSDAMPAHSAPAVTATHAPPDAQGQAMAQANREAASSHGRRPDAKTVSSHPSHSANSPAPAASGQAHSAHPERPAVAAHPERPAVAAAPATPAAPATRGTPAIPATPATPARPAGAQDLPPAAAAPSVDTTPPGNSGAAHSAK